MRLTKCPGCHKRHNWKYGRPIIFAGYTIPTLECINTGADHISFSMGQPMTERVREDIKKYAYKGPAGPIYS